MMVRILVCPDQNKLISNKRRKVVSIDKNWSRVNMFRPKYIALCSSASHTFCSKLDFNFLRNIVQEGQVLKQHIIPFIKKVQDLRNSFEIYFHCRNQRTRGIKWLLSPFVQLYGSFMWGFIPHWHWAPNTDIIINISAIAGGTFGNICISGQYHQQIPISGQTFPIYKLLNVI